MISRVRLYAVMLTLLGTLSLSPMLPAQTYRATSLGVSTYSAAINNSGQIAGYTKLTGMDQPFLWANGTLTFLGMSGGFAGQAFGINDNEQIVGEIAGLTGSTNVIDAALWANGTVTNLSNTLHGLSYASGINSSGQVVGVTNPIGSTACGGSLDNAFVSSGGTISILDPSTSVNSIALAINDAGDAVGYVQSALVSACAAQAALFTGGTTTILPQLPGGDSSTQTVANGINNAGQIVGYVFTPDALGAPNTPVLWYNGTVTALMGMGQAFGINDTGYIVGLIVAVSQAGHISHAALWTAMGAEPLDLNQLIDPATPLVSASAGDNGPLVLIQATAINDSGWIAAVGSVDGGTTVQSFLLQPETFPLNLTPSSLTFASQTIATTSAAQPVTVDNSGATAFSVSAIQVTGDFQQTNECGTSIPAGSSCKFEVKFAPTAPGTRAGVLTLTSGGTSYTVDLTGTGASSVASTPSATSAGGGGAIDAPYLLSLMTMLGIRHRRMLRERILLGTTPHLL